MMHCILLMIMATIVVGDQLHAQTARDSSRSANTSLKGLSIGGYIQAEWQHFDQITSVGGRAFYSDPRGNFFTIRRGRIKFQHRLGEVMSYVIQPDITERGVSIKDAYLKANLLPSDPDNDMEIRVGMFTRPNLELELSSSRRESSERSAIIGAFYPGVFDLGAMITIGTVLYGLHPKLQIGLLNGTGVSAEVDSYKDVIARLTFALPLGDDAPLSVNLGTSFYYGGVPQNVDSLLISNNGETQFVHNDVVGSVPGWGNRRNFNVEWQTSFEFLPFGPTIIRGEFLTGRRPTQAVAAIMRDTANFIPERRAQPFQIRNQSGYYLYVVQNIQDWVQVAGKLDVFDRNTDLEGAEVMSVRDAESIVLGMGVNVFIDNIRLTLWYEIPRFETDENIQRTDGALPLVEFRNVDLQDNKTTLRFQYSF